VVTAVGGGGVGEQILKALRLARRYRIVGTDVRSENPQFGLVDLAVRVPPAGDPEYMDSLVQICRAENAVALFPGSEAELRAISAARSRLEDAGVLLPINPPGVIELCSDKARTAQFLSDHGFQSPRSVELHDLIDVRRVDFFPVVVKPVRGGGGSADCFIAQSEKELLLVAEYLLLSGRTPVVQEYVGLPSQEYTVGVLMDLDGNLINSIAMRRILLGQLHVKTSVANRTGRGDLGDLLVISSGVSHGHLDTYPEVTATCETIAQSLGAKGAINIQCRLTNAGVVVFEINPRMSGTTSMRAMVGYNEPDILLRRHALGETIEPRFPYRSGLVLRSLTETLVEPQAIPLWSDL
jgi:carbamoyl-phosphate synthase large subunit